MEPGYTKPSEDVMSAPYTAFQDGKAPPHGGYAPPVGYVNDAHQPLVTNRAPAQMQQVIAVEMYSSMWYELNPQFYTGPFYCNSDDPNLCVPKRWGPGWIMNCGRPAARVIGLCLALLVIAVIVVCALLPDILS